MILDGKRLLITGVITKDSIAFHAAEQAQKEGAEVVLTSFGRVRRMTERAAQRLPQPADVLELDVNKPDDLEALTELAAGALGWRGRGAARDRLRAPGRARRRLHDRAGAERDGGLPDQRVLAQGAGGGAGAADAGRARGSSGWTSTPPWRGRSTTGWASPRRRSSRSSRYLARDLGPHGIRVNLVSAGPLGTVAARGIPGFEQLADLWRAQAPLGWDIEDPVPVARAICWLLSDYAQAISGEIVHVDGGFHAVGAPARRASETDPARPSAPAPAPRARRRAMSRSARRR